MTEKLQGRTGQWGLAALAALTGIAAWFVLNSYHAHVMENQPAGGWPSSLLDAVLIMPSFIAGLVVMMVPCVLQMSVVFTSMTAGMSAISTDRRAGGRPGVKVLAQTGLFILGYVAFYSAAGAALGAFGQRLALLGDTLLFLLRFAGGLLMAALGLHLSGLLNFKIASYCRGPVGFLLGVEPKGRFGSLRAGIAFAIYCIGCCGPYIFAVLVMAAASGSALLSALFLFFFSLGMALPFFLIAISHRFAVRYLEVSSKRMAAISKVSGTVLIVFGVLTALASKPMF